MGNCTMEMAYFGVNAISTGDHPAIKYNLVLIQDQKKNTKRFYYLRQN